MKRIYWLDGLKGVASLGVFWHHFILSFFPALYYGTAAVSHMNNNLDSTLAQSPLLFFVAGNYLVCLFCLISGFVMSYQIMNYTEKENASMLIVKRYLKLALPMFFISLIVFIFMKLYLFKNIEISDITGSKWLASLYNNTNLITLKDVFINSFITVWFKESTVFSTAFWVLKNLFIGSFISIILSEIYWKYKKKSIIPYIFISIVFLKIDIIYLLFSLGTMLACFLKTTDNLKNKNKHYFFMGIILLVLGILLGGYPSAVIPTNIYSHINLPNSISKDQFCHIIGAFFTVWGLFYLDLIQKLLSTKIFQFFGSISFSLYLVHIPIMCSFSMHLFRYLYIKTNRYQFSSLITWLISNLVIVLAAFLFTRYIEKYCNKFANKLLNN